MNRLKSGIVGWALLSTFVLAWDYGVALQLEGETLSTSFRRAARNPKGRWPVVVVWGVTTLHLFGRLPARYDPFIMTARILSND